VWRWAEARATSLWPVTTQLYRITYRQFGALALHTYAMMVHYLLMKFVGSRLNQLIKILLLIWVLMPGLALAHPHVWVEMRTDVVFSSDGKISGIDIEWNFDDAYAADALQGMDTNGDGEYSQVELVALTNENLDSIKDYDYFTKMWGADKILQTGPPINAGQTYNGNKLQLHFTLPLLQPFDARAAEFKVKIYDPEFYIAFDYGKELPVGTDGPIATGCELILKPLPTDAEIFATQEMLASKGVDWKPENGEDFGSMFAQALVVTCKS
jgi:ABC-type uncharacterized transport system substrate-binding protein